MPDASTPTDTPSTDTPSGRIPRLRRVARSAFRSRRRITGLGVAIAFIIAGGLLAALVVDRPKGPALTIGKAGIKTTDTPPVSPRPPEPPPAPDDDPDVTPPPSEHVESGQASYYGQELAGSPTASGERFDPAKLTAAHPTLPLGTKLRVTNLRNGTSVVVRVNDRGPFAKRRIVDLSYAAARRLGMIRTGTAPVRIERIR